VNLVCHFFQQKLKRLLKMSRKEKKNIEKATEMEIIFPLDGASRFQKKLFKINSIKL
jgi:hypothetical protein